MWNCHDNCLVVLPRHPDTSCLVEISHYLGSNHVLLVMSAIKFEALSRERVAYVVSSCSVGHRVLKLHPTNLFRFESVSLACQVLQILTAAMRRVAPSTRSVYGSFESTYRVERTLPSISSRIGSIRIRYVMSDLIPGPRITAHLSHFRIRPCAALIV